MISTGAIALLLRQVSLSRAAQDALDDLRSPVLARSVRLDAPIKAGSAENAGDTLLFFMHIPRTGGRNGAAGCAPVIRMPAQHPLALAHAPPPGPASAAMLCLLQQAFAPSRRCLRSYDRLRLERGCELVSTHDDLSSAAEASRDRHGLAVVTSEVHAWCMRC